MSGHRVYAAKIEGQVVGGVRLKETESGRIKLSRLGVHEDWKGNGIGSKLLEFAESVGQQEDYSTLWLTTPGEHPYLPAFYQSHGYEKAGDYPLDNYDYDESIMEKQL
jgi:ribosomal protein S18 acetylase RimI-like enzyme